MRTSGEYLPLALKRLRVRSLPDCSETMGFDGHVAAVVRVGTASKGEDALTGEEVREGVRVLASAADFPGLAKGAFVSLADRDRIAVSVRTDPARAMLTVGLSEALSHRRSEYRRGGTSVRMPLDVLATEGETLEPSGNAFAPVDGRSWVVAVAAASWLEPTDPQIGDTLVLDDGTVLRVAAVNRQTGHFVLSCRSRR